MRCCRRGRSHRNTGQTLVSAMPTGAMIIMRGANSTGRRPGCNDPLGRSVCALAFPPFQHPSFFLEPGRLGHAPAGEKKQLARRHATVAGSIPSECPVPRCPARAIMPSLSRSASHRASWALLAAAHPAAHQWLQSRLCPRSKRRRPLLLGSVHPFLLPTAR